MTPIELIASHEADVGGMTVRRALPRRARRTVGPWCFVDHIGPATIDPGRPADVGPHPHIGLQTVTWIIDGRLVHRDSLGSEVEIRPGQLNVMTAGHGVSHSEESEGYDGPLHGAQLWVAQPDATRNGPAAFEHHAELPHVALANGEAAVFVGGFGGVHSPARADTDHSGVELRLRRGSSVLSLRPDHEYAVIVLDGAVHIDGMVVAPGSLGFLGDGRDTLTVDVHDSAIALLLGGEAWPQPPLMWWNFVARERSEIITAAEQWNAADPRFGTVDSRLARILAGDPPWPSAG